MQIDKGNSEPVLQRSYPNAMEALQLDTKWNKQALSLPRKFNILAADIKPLPSKTAAIKIRKPPKMLNM